MWGRKPWLSPQAHTEMLLKHWSKILVTIFKCHGHCGPHPVCLVRSQVHGKRHQSTGTTHCRLVGAGRIEMDALVCTVKIAANSES